MTDGLVILTPAQLQELVKQAVGEVLAEHQQDTAPPALVDRQGLARALGVSPGTVDKMRQRGCPEVRIGECPRFEVGAVVAWLKQRGGCQ